MTVILKYVAFGVGWELAVPTSAAEFLLIELARAFERHLIVLGGILAIFLGYKLFAIATLPNDSTGRIKTKVFEITATKIGPGVFFAALGAAILCYFTLASMRVPPAYMFSGPSSIPPANFPAPPAPLADESELESLKRIIDKLPVDDMDRRRLEALQKKINE